MPYDGAPLAQTDPVETVGLFQCLLPVDGIGLKIQALGIECFVPSLVEENSLKRLDCTG